MVWKRKTKHVVHTPYTQLPIKMFAIRNFAEIICAIFREIFFVSLVSLQCTILQRCDYSADDIGYIDMAPSWYIGIVYLHAPSPVG